MRDKERQDKIWSELSEDSQGYLISLNRELEKEYEEYNKEHEDNCASSRLERLIMLEDIFGEHNLSPLPKTWEDMEKIGHSLWTDRRGLRDVESNVGIIQYTLKQEYPERLIRSMIAAMKIYKLIEVGYGGHVTDEEWKSSADLSDICSIRKTHLGCVIIAKKINCSYCDRGFISFHHVSQAEDFLSHPENEKLIDDYFID